MLFMSVAPCIRRRGLLSQRTTKSMAYHGTRSKNANKTKTTAQTPRFPAFALREPPAGVDALRARYTKTEYIAGTAAVADVVGGMYCCRAMQPLKAHMAKGRGLAE